MTAILNAFVTLSFAFVSSGDIPPLDPDIVLPIEEGCTAEPYYLWNTFYTPGWISNDTWYRQTPQHTIGKAMWYAPGIMDTTARYRGMNTDGFKGGVSVISPGNIGRVVWLKRPDMSWEGPYIVVDSSQRNHAYSHTVSQGEHVEVSFDIAREWGLVQLDKSVKKGYSVNEWVSSYDVELYFGLLPPKEDIGEPIRMEEWYRKTARFCDEEPNRRWELEGWEITNYEEYVLAANSEIENNVVELSHKITNIKDKKYHVYIKGIPQ